MPLQPGQILSHYRLTERIGAGGMGVVYRARNLNLDTDVALKVLPDRSLEDEDARRRFEKEAKRLSRLNHPNIAIVHDFDRSDGVDFLIMEYVPGVTLQDKLVDGPLPESETLDLAVQLTSGLEAAHTEGIVHRDIKPSNVRVTPEGKLKILDFGLAKLLRTTETASTLSLAGATAGTPPYMAPEQFDGHADQRTDVYGAGTVLYEMSTGRRPFVETEMQQLMRAILSEAPDPPHSLNDRTSPELEFVVLKALDKDPDRRYQSMREMRVDLQRMTQPASSLPPRHARTTRHGLRLRRPHGVAIVGVVVAFVIVFVARSLFEHDSNPFENPILLPLSTSSDVWIESRLSPDGQFVSFIANEGEHRGLWIQRAVGGQARQVLEPTGALRSHIWSPDGGEFAVRVALDEGDFLQFVPMFGGAPTRSVELEEPLNAGTLVRWVSDHLYISAGALWRYDTATDQAVMVMNEVGAAGERRYDFDVCQDEDRVAFATAGPRPRVWSASLPENVAEPLTSAEWGSGSPRWLGSDCRYLVCSSRSGGQSDLWGISPRDRSARQITFSTASEAILDTSLDGTKLVFLQTQHRSDIWRMDPRDVDRRWRLTSASQLDYWPSASKDGSLVAFQRLEPTAHGGSPFSAELYLAERDPAGLANAQLLAQDGGAPLLSPNGRWLAFVRAAEKGYEIWVSDLRSHHSWRAAEQFSPPVVWSFPREWLGPNRAWSPDGGTLFFVARVPGKGSEIRRLHVELSATESETLISHADSLSLGDLHPSPDGRFLSYLTYTHTTTQFDVRYLDLASQATQASGQARTSPGVASSLAVAAAQHNQVSGTDHTLVAWAREFGWVRSRGWLNNSESILVLRTQTNPDWTHRVELFEVPRSSPPRALGAIDRVLLATARLGRNDATLYYIHVDEAQIHNLYAFSIADGSARQLTKNTLRGVSYSGPETLDDGTILYTQQEELVSTWLIQFQQPSQQR